MEMQQAQKPMARRNGVPKAMPLAATQSAPALQRMATILNQSPHVTQLQAQAAGLQSGLPANLRTGVESLSGMAMDHVKVHYNSSKPAQLNAHAYTQGSDIHVAPGQEQHLAHEAWHVVQQAQGRVQPTTQLAGTHINDDLSLESEADHMGARALGLGGDHGPAVPVQNKANTGAMVAQLRNNTEISYQQGTLNWRGTNNPLHIAHQTTVGLATSAFLDPEDPEQGERTAPAPGGIYANGNYAGQNGGNNLIQGHLLNANLGGKAQPFNLFPITTEMNRSHSTLVEDSVKYMLLDVLDQRQAEGSVAVGGPAPILGGPPLSTGANRAGAALPGGPALLSNAFANDPGAGYPIPNFNWDNVRIYYHVNVNAPGINGAAAMQPNTLRQEEFHCLAYYTTNNGIAPNFNLPHVDNTIRAPRNLNNELGALGFGPTPSDPNLHIGGVIAGVAGGPTQHDVLDGPGNIVGHATLFNHP